MTVCDRTCDPPCSYGCELGQKGVRLSAAATPSRVNFHDGKAAKPNPAWERGTITEARPGGFRMPILRPDGAPLRVKEYGEKRRAIDAQIRNLKNRPTPLPDPR